MTETKEKPTIVPRRDFTGTMLTQIKLSALDPYCAKYIADVIKPTDLLQDPDVNKGRNIETNQHITLHLGAKEKTQGMIDFIANTSAFEIIIHGLDSFSNAPRKFKPDDTKEHAWDVLFAKIQDPSGTLQRLNQMMVKESGVENDYAFHPHLTLCYLKHGTSAEYIRLHQSGKASLGPWKILVNSVDFKEFQKRGPEPDKMEATLFLKKNKELLRPSF